MKTRAEEETKLKALEEPKTTCPVLPRDKRQPPTVSEGTAGDVRIETDHRICGVESQSVENLLLSQAMHSDGRAISATPAARIQPVVALMDSIDPMNAIEGMMAAQMIALHNMAMDCSRRAAASSQSLAGRDMNLRHATKLMNAFTNAATALDKHRGKGQQKITVEHQHVQVESGAQAIIGDVNLEGRVKKEK
jgi:hypothetical protein